jgi:hypothetical protein
MTPIHFPDTIEFMQRVTLLSLPRVLTLLTALLILEVTLSVLAEYRNYFPPDFKSPFLLGREGYFWGAYSWAFYTHLIAGPMSLVLGGILVSQRARRAFPIWHRWVGRIQAVVVLLFLVHSGLWMAPYAQTGWVAAGSLGSLALATAVDIVFGWKSAVRRRWASHRRWMWRTFILLCSAVVIRLIGGLATVAHFDAPWLYSLSTWVSWLVPLAVFEVARRLSLQIRGVAARQNAP